MRPGLSILIFNEESPGDVELGDSQIPLGESLVYYSDSHAGLPVRITWELLRKPGRASAWVE